jgi:hypothetical protein
VSERKYVVWNADDEEITVMQNRVDEVLATIPKKYQEAVLNLSNIFMDLGAAHYRKQLRMVVNGEVQAFLIKGENK